MNKHQATILIVEDEPVARERLRAHLHHAGYRCQGADSVKQALAVLKRRTPDLVLLDIQLPDAADFNFAASIRRQYASGLIIVSSLAEHDDRLRGLRAGADDYICKPFDMNELLLKVKNLLRRLHAPQPTGDADIKAIRFNQWRYHPDRLILLDPTGRNITVTKAEHDVLMLFLHNPNRIITRNEFIGGILGENVYDRAVDSRISRLKKKLDIDPDADNPIQSVYGEGYLFSAEVTVESA